MGKRNRNPLLLGMVMLIVIVLAGTYALLSRMNTIVEQNQTAASLAQPAEETVAAGNLQIGAKLPDIEFTTPDGEVAHLADYLDGQHYLVVNFTHPDCPCARNCSMLINEMEADGYEDVRVIGLLASGYDDPRVIDAIRAQRDEGVLNYPVYYDKDQKAMKLLGATRTPEMWVLDKDGTIRFYGAPENTLFPGSEGHRYLLREAIDALRAGKTPEIQSYRPIGCPIEG